MYHYLLMAKNKGGNEMFKSLRNLIMISATILIGLAENSTTMMCSLFMDEIELPEELKNTKF